MGQVFGNREMDHAIEHLQQTGSLEMISAAVCSCLLAMTI